VYGSPERRLYDDLAGRERAGVFMQAYVKADAPGGWSYRWVRVPTPYPQEGRPYTVVGEVEPVFGNAPARKGGAITESDLLAQQAPGGLAGALSAPATASTNASQYAPATGAWPSAPSPFALTAGDTVPAGLREPWTDLNAAVAPPDFSKAEFDPAWGSPPLEIQGGLLRWNPSRRIYELRPGLPGPGERAYYDDLATRERNAIFMQAYADPDSPGGWNFRWVRVSEEGSPYIVLGDVTERSAWSKPLDIYGHADIGEKIDDTVRALEPLGATGEQGPVLGGTGKVKVGVDFREPIFDLLDGKPLFATGEQGSNLGGTGKVKLGVDFREPTFDLLDGTPLFATGEQDSNLGESAQVGAEFREPLFESGEDRFEAPSTVGEMTDYVWVPNEDLPPKCPYPHAFMPVPIADYESGRWLEPDYVPSRALPKPYDEPEWPCKYEETVFEGRKSIGRIVDFREPEVPDAPAQRFAPMPLEELDEPEPVEEAELDLFATSVHSALFPDEASVPIAGSAQVQTALADLDAPLFGYKDYEPPMAGQATSTDLTAFAWIPQRDLPYGCPYPHAYLPVPQEDFVSGAWLMPTYVPSIPLPHPYDLTPWRCGQVIGGESGRGKGGKKQEPDPGSPYYGVIRKLPPKEPEEGGAPFGDEETDAAIEADSKVQDLRKERDELQAHVDALEASGQPVPAGLALQLAGVKTTLYRRENKVGEAFNRKREKELRIERAKLKYKLSTTGNLEKRKALENTIGQYDSQIEFRHLMADMISNIRKDEGRVGTKDRTAGEAAVRASVAFAEYGPQLGFGAEGGLPGSPSVAELGDGELKELEYAILDHEASSSKEATDLSYLLDAVRAELAARKLGTDRYGVGTVQEAEARERGTSLGELTPEFDVDPRDLIGQKPESVNRKLSRALSGGLHDLIGSLGEPLFEGPADFERRFKRGLREALFGDWGKTLTKSIQSKLMSPGSGESFWMPYFEFGPLVVPAPYPTGPIFGDPSDLPGIAASRWQDDPAWTDYDAMQFHDRLGSGLEAGAEQVVFGEFSKIFDQGSDAQKLMGYVGLAVVVATLVETDAPWARDTLERAAERGTRVEIGDILRPLGVGFNYPESPTLPGIDSAFFKVDVGLKAKDLRTLSGVVDKGLGDFALTGRATLGFTAAGLKFSSWLDGDTRGSVEGGLSLKFEADL
jgi:hypothetical protein